MKHKFCLIRHDGQLDVGDFVYVIWCGDSLRELSKLYLIQNFCDDCNWYFAKWSPAVDSELDKKTIWSQADGSRIARPYRMISLSVSACYDAIIDDSFAAIERESTMTPSEKWCRFHNTIAYNQQMNVRKRGTTRPPSTRKYLSHRKREQGIQVAISIAFILGVFIIDAIVTNLFGL